MDITVDLMSYQYKKKDCLGMGQFGKVFLGHRKEDSSKLLAIKRIDRDRLLPTEIQILKELSSADVQHTNLVQLIDHIEEDEFVYLVMEYCNGGDLGDYLKEKRKMDGPSLKIFLRQIASAMKVLYDLSIIHRDLKPANILLAHNGTREINNITFKIADFGLGRFLDAGEYAQTYCGTPVFMAPELFVSNPKYDYKVDLWSIGVIVYLCLTGTMIDSFRKTIVFPLSTDPLLKDLLTKLLCNNPQKRISFNDFYKHPFIGLKVQRPPERYSISPPAEKITPALTPRKPFNVLTNKPPNTFKLQQIRKPDEIDGIDKAPSSPVTTPRPFTDKSIFLSVDEHAEKVSETEHDSIRELIWHLIDAGNITNDLEQARALFVWLCSKDLAELNFKNEEKNDSEESFARLKLNEMTYASVYEELCGYVGLHCETIAGYAKTGDFKIGVKLAEDGNRHSWNAVSVNGVWQIVDCRAARVMVVKNKSPTSVRYELDEFYFMPYPKQLIYSHFPDDSSWQLLETPITKVEFEKLVPVTSIFFQYGLELISHREAVIKSKREERIRIGYPGSKVKNLSFTMTLSNDNGKDTFHGVHLERFGMLEKKDNEIMLTIRLPENGSYRLSIFARCSTGKTETLKVCEYQMLCEMSPAHPLPFPPVETTTWGPGHFATKYQLIPLQKGIIAKTVNGLVELRFKVPKNLCFLSKLKHNDSDEEVLSGYLMHRMVEDVAVFTIRTPCKGEFGLEIWINDPELDGNCLYHAYQYLIICDETVHSETMVPIRGLSGGYLGPQKQFKNLGLSTVSHLDPYIQSNDNEIKVNIKASQPIRMTPKLSHVLGFSNEVVKSEYVLQQVKGDNFALLLKLTKPGFYKLDIYATTQSDFNEGPPRVFSYLINFTGNHDPELTQYPKQLERWGEGHYLHEPLQGQIRQNRVRFKVEVPRAKSVRVEIGEGEGEIPRLELGRNATGEWEGELDLEKYRGHGHGLKVTVYANYDDIDDYGSALLVYSVLPLS